MYEYIFFTQGGSQEHKPPNPFNSDASRMAAKNGQGNFQRIHLVQSGVLE